MRRRYRVVIHVSGGNGDGENVLWEGTFEDLRAKYGDDPDANPIQSSEAAANLTVRNVVQKETKAGWQDCADPRLSLIERSSRHDANTPDRPHMAHDVVPLHGLREGEPVLEEGGLVERTMVTLGLHGDDLDPSEITRMIGREPTSAHRRGEPRPGPKFKNPYRSGAWLLSVEVEKPSEPDEATERLLDLLPSDEKLWKKLSERYDLSISYGIFFKGWNRGFALSRELQQRLVKYHARLDFDLYADESDPKEFSTF